MKMSMKKLSRRSILGIIVYGVLLWYSAIAVLMVTAFLGVVVLLGILGWIGWTMATTPPPEPMPEMTGAGGQGSTAPSAPATGGADKKPSG